MADTTSPGVAEVEEPPRPSQPEQQPPPLDEIRVKSGAVKGLNKPAIMMAAGGGLATILVLASGVLNDDSRRKPADTKPMMSDPARPDMAKSAIRELPADYAQAAAGQAAPPPANPPHLGPPLPGDVAAFAPSNSGPRHYAPSPDVGWSDTQETYHPVSSSPTIQDEGVLADRSSLFFALRDQPRETQQAIQPVPSDARQTGSPGRQDGDGSRANSGPALFPGSIISASLMTELNSEAPGPVIAHVTQAVSDSATGRVVLIPQGARLIGEYRSSSKYGQSRVAVIWSRLIMPDGAEIILDEIAADPSGAAGVSGRVDNHWFDVFGAAALGTLINVGVASAEEPQLTYGGIGLRDPVEQAINDGVQRTASIVTNRVVDRSLTIAPTIRIEAGKRLTVIVTRRISL